MSSEEHLHPSLTRQGLQDMTDSDNLPWVSLLWQKVSVGGGIRRTSNVTWTPTFRKQQLARKGVSQRVQNHNQHRVTRIEPVFLAVQSAIRAKMKCDKKSLLVEADASKKCICASLTVHSVRVSVPWSDTRNSIWLPCNNEWAHDQRQENLRKFDVWPRIYVMTYINIFCASPHPLSVSPIYTETHRDTGMKSAYVTDPFATKFKVVRRLIMSEDFWEWLELDKYSRNGFTLKGGISDIRR